MTQKKRRMIAYITGRLILNKESNAVYDHDAKAYFNAAGACGKSKIAVYDYERQCYMIGVFTGQRISIFDHGSRKYVELKIKGKKFEGFDYESSMHFGGEADAKAVSLYDFADKKYHHYVV